MITLAKRGDLAARRTVVSELPNEPLVVAKLFDVIAPKYADRTSGTPAWCTSASAGATPPRSSRSSWSDQPVSMRVREGSAVRYRARCEYDGTDFAGFQLQPNARTVQGELEAALARLNGGERVVVDGAGRTDAGVHAIGQVIAFTYDGVVPGTRLQRAVNALLPPDVAIRDLRRAPDGFHPRYAARYREYRYTVWNGPRSPLRERHALGVRAPLDIAAMASAASVFTGRHDFSAFGGSGPVRRSGPCTWSGSGRRVAW